MHGEISRRIKASINALDAREYEQALLNVFPAMDNTARRRRPNDGVGERIKKFVRDQTAIIAPIGLKVQLGQGCTFGGMSLEDAIYVHARNNLVHEGGLPPEFAIHDQSYSVLGGNWKLSEDCVYSLILAVVTAVENASVQLSSEKLFPIFGQTFHLNELWGKEAEVKELIKAAWPKPN
jgi:hypothetical protein